MANCIITDHSVVVDADRLDVALQASYQIDEELGLLEKLCGLQDLNGRAWRRLVKDSLIRLRAFNEVAMACADEPRVSGRELEARLKELA